MGDPNQLKPITYDFRTSDSFEPVPVAQNTSRADTGSEEANEEIKGEQSPSLGPERQIVQWPPDSAPREVGPRMQLPKIAGGAMRVSAGSPYTQDMKALSLDELQARYRPHFTSDEDVAKLYSQHANRNNKTIIRSREAMTDMTHGERKSAITGSSNQHTTLPNLLTQDGSPEIGMRLVLKQKGVAEDTEEVRQQQWMRLQPQARHLDKITEDNTRGLVVAGNNAKERLHHLNSKGEDIEENPEGSTCPETNVQEAAEVAGDAERDKQMEEKYVE